MPIRGIQNYKSSGEATEEYFNNTDETSRLLTAAEVAAEIPPGVSTVLASGDVNTMYKGGTSDGNQVLNKQEVLALPPAEVATVDGMQYVPQSPNPTPVEGLTFYDDSAKALSVYSDKDDFTLNLGQEVVVRVVNATGATIPNGTPCYQSGISAGGVPQIAPAVASTVETGTIVGIATHEIPNGEEGFITAFGKLSGDFSSFNVGDVLYLSDITPGGYVTDTPDIASKCGTVLVGEVNGSLLVRIASVIALPTAVGWIYGLSVPTYNLVSGAAATPLIGYDNEDHVFLPADAENGNVDIPYSGVYRVTVTFTATFTADAKTGRTFMLDLYDVTGAALITSFGYPIPTDSNIITGTATAPTRLIEAHLIQLQIRCLGDDVDGIQFQNITFAAESIQIK